MPPTRSNESASSRWLNLPAHESAKIRSYGLRKKLLTVRNIEHDAAIIIKMPLRNLLHYGIPINRIQLRGRIHSRQQPCRADACSCTKLQKSASRFRRRQDAE